jgi:hypothetical protein
MNGIPIGQILVMREEFATVAAKPNEPPAMKRRAQILKELLDELIHRREKDLGANG